MIAFLCREFGPIRSHKVEEIDELMPGSHDIVINVQMDVPLLLCMPVTWRQIENMHIG